MAAEQGYFPFAAPRLGERYIWEADWIAFDFETTGLDPVRDRIVEIGAVLYRKGKYEDAFHTLVNPERPIPYGAKRIHGIGDEEVAGAPSLELALPPFLDLLQDRLIIAHNLPFDYSFLESAVSRIGLEIESSALFADTLTFARAVYPGRKGYSLSKLCESLSIDQGEAHRAVSDASACMNLFIHLLETSEDSIMITKERKSVDSIIQYSRSRIRKL